MTVAIACVAPGRRSALSAAGRVAASLPRARVEAFTLAAYLGSDGPPDRIVLCPAGLSMAADLRFLSLAAARLLWPAPPGGLRAAIGGIRPHGERLRRALPPPRTGPPGRTGTRQALLLEGRIDRSRALAALAAAGPRDWIVESPRQVRVTAAVLRALEREGIRWSTLAPIDLVAVAATPALARARARWKHLFPARTPVWISR